MSTASRVTAIVSVIGGLFAIYYTLISMGVFSGFETEIGNSNVAQMVFMCLVIMMAVAITYETVFILKKPKDLLSNLQTGLAKYTGSSEQEVGRFFGDVVTKAKGAASGAVSKLAIPDLFKDAASGLIEQIPTTVKVNQIITKKGRRGEKKKRKVFEVQVDSVKYPTPAQLLAKLRATFASLPLEPAQVVKVNQVSSGTILVGEEDEIVIYPVEAASADDSTPVTEYVKQRNRRSLYFVIGCAIACLLFWILSIYF